MTDRPFFIGLELGGTKCIAALAQGSDILARITVPTEAPDTTLGRLAEQVSEWAAARPVAGIGIGSFGPLAPSPGGPALTGTGATPKRGWTDVPIVARFAGLGLPILLDTDVAAAALAEYRWGARAGADMLVYLTVGTGIGGAILVDGRPIHGALHPEIGHIRVRRPAGDNFPGTCPFHGDCLEGLASGPALAARAGLPGDTLPPDHPAWTAVADALAETCAMLMLAVSPRHILIGGGVGCSAAFPLDTVRRFTLDRLRGYVAGMDGDRIGCATLGAEAGPLGAVALAMLAAEEV